MQVEQIGDCTLYCGDAVEVVPSLPHVDVVMTDAPYVGLRGGTTLKGTNLGPIYHPTRTVGDPWHASYTWVAPAWDWCTQALFAWTAQAGLRSLADTLPQSPLTLVVWHKRNRPPSVQNVPQFSNEYCWVWSKSSRLAWRKLPTHLDIPMLQGGCIPHPERLLLPTGQAAHPTQKPIAVFEPLLAVGGQSIGDPFMGTGTVGIACLKQRRHFVGIEINQTYFDLACHRIEAATKQLDLFTPAAPAPTQPRLFPVATRRPA